jgi:hypothetical protein
VIAVYVPVEGPIQQVDFNENDVDSWVKQLDPEGSLDTQGIDFITLRESGLQVLVDDHSVTNAMPMNVRMTWFMRGTGRWLSEVYGPALMVGVHPDSGETINLHEVLASALVAG